MRQVKEINIKNQRYFSFDMINIKSISVKSQLRNLVIVKIFSVNLLYLIVHSATGYFKEKNDEKYLILDSTGFLILELDQKLKHLIVEKNCSIKKKLY